MLRSILLILLALGLANNVGALTVGALETNSGLYQKFFAQIPLSESKGQQVRDVQVSLASADDFERMGVERLFFLTQLQIEVTPVSGRPVVQIRSTRPITEPYLNFVLEVAWRGGRMLKEYTVFLDPPTRVANAPTAQPPQSVAAAKPNKQTGPRTSRYGPTKRNDTLWAIATRTRPNKRVTMAQHMLAIKALNPDAFINDNINLLKRGQVLEIPALPDVAVISHSVAAQKVQEEEDAWQAERQASIKQVQAEPARGQLRILPQTEPVMAGSVRFSSEGSKASGTAVETLDHQLETLTESADTQQLPSLKQQAADQAQALVIRDRQIAELKAQVAEMQEEMKRLVAARQQETTAGAANNSAVIRASVFGIPTGWLGMLALLLVGVTSWLLGRGRR
ncbi:MAG: type IV pilus assembly protein FimV [Pseudomonadales bacterium]